MNHRQRKELREKHKRFYNGNYWEELRNRVFINNNYLCAECLKQGKVKECKIGHHIKPLRTHWHLRLDYDNIQPVCHDCHEQLEKRVSQMQKFLKDWEGVK